MSAMTDATTGLETFAEALSRKEFEQIGQRLEPMVRFRGLTPKSTYGLFGREGAVATYKLWFDGSPEIELLANQVESIGDRVRLSYRFRLFDPEQAVLCVLEQQAYCRLRNGLISDIAVVCSGFLPLE